MEGSCQCGKITFRTPVAKPLWIHCCHCLDCQCQSGSAFGIAAIFPYFELPESRYLAHWSRKYEDGSSQLYYFCGGCGSHLMDVFGSREVFVKAGCLKGLTKEMMKTAAHIFTNRAIVDIPNGAEQYLEHYPKGYIPWRMSDADRKASRS